MKTFPKDKIGEVLKIVRKKVREFRVPVVARIRDESKSPFKVLISCVLSLRTKDAVTRQASSKLFALADTPQSIFKLPVKKIECTIYPVGFYRTKAKNIKGICADLLEKYAGEVPSEIDELLKLKGVGRKTANLVVTLGYNKPGICVDTHVHRISNRWGYVQTKNPHQTETELRRILPRRYWLEYNDLLVTFGQNICKPVRPLCGECGVKGFCILHSRSEAKGYFYCNMERRDI